MFVVDSGTVVTASLSKSAFELFGAKRLVGPPLLWPESTSVLHEMRARKLISPQLVKIAVDRIKFARIAPREPGELLEEAWKVADQLGWARTYSAHYVALARLLKCPLVTIDPRVKETASGLVEVIGPQDVADLPPRDSGL